MRVHVPEPRQEPGAAEIEAVLGAGRAAVPDLADRVAVDAEPRVAARLRGDRVDEVYARDHEAHPAAFPR